MRAGQLRVGGKATKPEGLVLPVKVLGKGLGPLRSIVVRHVLAPVDGLLGELAPAAQLEGVEVHVQLGRRGVRLLVVLGRDLKLSNAQDAEGTDRVGCDVDAELARAVRGAGGCSGGGHSECFREEYGEEEVDEECR